MSNIDENLLHYIIICLKRNIPPIITVIGFDKGSVRQSYQVLEVGVILKMRLNFQIIGPSIIRTLVPVDGVRTTTECSTILNQK